MMSVAIAKCKKVINIPVRPNRDAFLNRELFFTGDGDVFMLCCFFL